MFSTPWSSHDRPRSISISRGNWRGRGRPYRRDSRARAIFETRRPPSPPFGLLLKTLRAEDITNASNMSKASETIAGITNSRYIASYNLLENDAGTVLVPGMPPKWTPLREARKLDLDSGNYYRDPNSARYPIHPMEPAVRALLLENEDFVTQEIDLFACSSTIGSLLCLLRGIEKPFRFFVEVVGHTVFFTRHENSPDECIPNVKGYGHTFPESYTTWDASVKGSASHQRALRYDFSGLKLLVRYAADGYLPEKSHTAATQASTSDASSDDIVDIIGTTWVASSTARSTTNVLQLKSAGRHIEQAAVFDLKTRSVRNPRTDTLEEELPRLWISQIPNFVLARHTDGRFGEIHVQDVEDHVDDWERDNQEVLHALSWLIREIIRVAKSRDDKKIEVRRRELDMLELREQDSDNHDVLPVELKELWERTDETESEDSQTEEALSSPDDKSTGIQDSEDMYPSSGSDTDFEPDYTACSAEDCGYCGRCMY